MSDNKLDICRMPEFGIETRHEIPYDVDFLWNDGCGGEDCWNDRAGTSVDLLVSEDGSAYVCPNGPEALWRIYVDKFGRAFELGHWPRPKSIDYEVSDATEEFADVLACAKTNRAVPEDVVNAFNVYSAPSRDSRIHAMKPGLEVELSDNVEIHGVYDWKIQFQEGKIILSNKQNWDSFIVDSVPIASNTYEDEWGHNHHYVDCYEPTDRKTLIDLTWQLGAYAENTVGLQSAAMDLAARVFDRACRTMLEIEAFEAACYGDTAAPPKAAEPQADAGIGSASAPSPRKVIVIGDSIVAGYDYLYPSIIGQSLNPDQVEVHAKGRNGDTIYRALGVKEVDGERKVHLESTLRGGYDEMILALGVNSVAAGWKASALRDSIYDACDIAMETGVERIILVEIAPWKGWMRWTERKQAETMRYNEMLGRLTNELNYDFAMRGCETMVEVARVYSALEDEAQPGYLKYPRTVHSEIDRLHPDEQGLRIIADEIVEQMYSDSTTEDYRHEKERLKFKAGLI